jgi:glycosyltransferase involved in cell wall biosynthesis
VLIGGLGHLDMLWFRCLKGADQVPVVFDPFLGLFDTVVEDRRIARPTSLAARAFLALDRGACSRADRILVDTDVMRGRFASTLGLRPERIHTVYQGQDDRQFRPADVNVASDDVDVARDAPARPTEVLFAGTYVPLQGVETILEAARLLAGRGVRFTIVGDGQARERVLAGVVPDAIPHVTFVHEWQSTSQLVRRMQQADICLGIFGTSRKAASVIPLKAVAALATGRPLITRDSPAARELLAHGRNAWLVPAGDPDALAGAIATLAADAALRARVARSGRALFVERLSPPALGRQLAGIVEEMVGARKRELANA